MKWFYSILLVAANQAMALAQSPSVVETNKSDDTANEMAMAKPAPLVPAIDPEKSDSLVWLSMAVVQVGNDYSYNPNGSEVRLQIKQLVHEIKKDFLPLNGKPTDFESKNSSDASQENLWHAREIEVSEKLRKISELINAKALTTLLAMPKIAVEVGSGAICNVGQQARLPYLEQTAPESFKLHYTETQQLGFDMLVTPQEIVPAASDEEERSVKLSPVKLTVTAIDGRQEIKGVDLPIGKPIITRRTIETSLQLTESEPGIVELPVAKGRHVFMVVFVRLPIKAAK